MNALGPLQTAWIAALRSGKYEQGYSSLLLMGEFCCLGVACKVLGLDEEIFYNRGTLPQSVVDQMKFRSKTGNSSGNLLRPSLASLNDDTRLPFSAIAAIVEASPAVYFTEAA